MCQRRSKQGLYKAFSLDQRLRRAPTLFVRHLDCETSPRTLSVEHRCLCAQVRLVRRFFLGIPLAVCTQRSHLPKLTVACQELIFKFACYPVRIPPNKDKNFKGECRLMVDLPVAESVVKLGMVFVAFILRVFVKYYTYFKCMARLC